MGSVAASLKHCYRERETLNADPERTPYNRDVVGTTSTDQAMGKLRERLPEKRRKDAVLAVEYMMGASPEWWETATKAQKTEFFDCSVAWLQDKYGKDNVIAATIHKDELTPHLSAYVVPITEDGRLCAKDFLGGKSRLSQDQTTYAECVQHLGLQRGIEGSKATHQRVKAHYQLVNGVQKQTPHITPDELKPQKAAGQTRAQKLFGAKEDDTGIAQRLSQKMKDAVEPVTAKAQEHDRALQRVNEMTKAVQSLRSELKRAQEPFLGLSEAERETVFNLAREMKQEKKRQRQASKKNNRER